MSDVEQIMKQYQDMFPKLDTEIIWSIMFEYLEKPNGNEQTLDKLVEISSNFDPLSQITIFHGLQVSRSSALMLTRKKSELL